MRHIITKLFLFVSLLISLPLQAQTTYTLSPDNTYTTGGNIIELKAFLTTGNKIVFSVKKQDGSTFNSSGVMTIRAGATNGCVANDDTYYWSYSAGATTVSKTFDLDDYPELGNSKNWYAAIGHPSPYCDGTPPTYYSGLLRITAETSSPLPYPSRPNSPSVSVSGYDAEISWSSVTTADKYRLLHSTSTTSSTFKSIYCGSNRSYIDKDLAVGRHNYRIQAGNSDASCNSSSDDGWSVMSNYDAAFIEEPTISDVTLQINLTGAGRVTGTTGIDCSSSCSTTLGGNSRIQLVAEPSDANSTFSWDGACSGTSTTCLLDMNQRDQTVSATFTAQDSGGSNQAPVMTLGNVKNNTYTVGEQAQFTSRWEDAEGNFVVDVTVRWRLQNNSNWQSAILDYVGDTNPPIFTTKQTMDVAGVYEFAFRASDAETASGTRINTTSWQSAGTFEVTEVSVPPPVTDEDKASFVSENYRDYSYVGSNQTFDKTWTVKNVGSTTWDSSYRLEYVSGKGLSVSQAAVAISGSVAPGSNYSFTVPMQAPSAQAVTRSYRDNWRLVNGSGQTVKVGNSDIVWALVKVLGTSPASQSVARNNGNTVGVNQGGYSGAMTPGNGNKGQVPNGGCGEGDPINTATGAQNISYTLLSVRGVLPLSFNLNYNSLLLADGVAGRGWGMNGMNTRLQERDNGDVAVFWSANQDNVFTKKADGSYNPVEIACRFDVLQKQADGRYSLTRQNNTVYEFDAEGQLTQLRNQRNQTLQYQYDEQNRLSKVTEPVSGVFLNYRYNSNGLLATVSDALGREVKLEYDAENNLTTIIDAAGQKTTHTYNAAGQILTASTAVRQLFSNTYDAQGRVVAQDDNNPANQVLTLVYSDTPDGQHVTTVTSRSGQTRRYVHDADYRILEATNELGHSAQTTYHPNGKVATVTDPKGRLTQFAYNEQGKLTQLTDAENHQTQLEYTSAGDLSKVTNALQQVLVLEYDAQRNLVAQTNAKQETTRYTYNEYGQVVSVVTPKQAQQQARSQITYANGLPAQITDAAGNVRRLEYDAAGRVVKIVAPAGQTTNLTYNAINLPTQICDNLSRCLQMTYNSEGQLLTLTDAKGNVSRREYDVNGNLVKQINALNQATVYVYDGEDRLINITDAKGNSSTLGYDAVGRLVSLTDGLGNAYQLSYDEVGNLTQQIDALGHPIATLDYDALNNVVSSRDALGNITRFEYDALSNLDKVVNPLQQITTLTQDTLNRVVEVMDAKGGKSTQGFDADGQRTSLRDPNGNETQFSFDLAGRLVATQIATGDSVQYRYQAGDLLAEITNARGQQRQFSYDVAGRLTGWTDADGTVQITYDANDNVLTVSDSTGTISREYDALDRIVKFTDVFGNVLQYSYDAVGNLQTLTYPDGKQVTYSYNAADQLVKVTDWAGRETVYEYDANGRLLTTQFANGTRMTRSYDAAGQLLQQQSVDASGALVTQYDYSYDAAGNIGEEKFVPEAEIFPFEPLEMTYDAANRLATYNGVAVGFDADGNMLQGPLNGEMADFGFDSRNRLVTTKDTQYVYDAENRRVAVNDTRYVVNPLPALSQTLVRVAADGSQTFYVYGLGLIAEESASGYQVYHYDLRGSTAAMTDAAGQVALQLQYGAYGELISHHPSEVDTPFLYNGRDGVMTDDNALYYMRARFYNPEIRRFVNQDVLLGFVADGQTLNRYAYVTGEPISFVDPFGLKKKDLTSELFDKLLKNYPDQDREDFIENIIKRKEGEAATENTCTLRVSYALNESGEIIPIDADPALISIGWDGEVWLAYRTNEMKPYITELFGEPIFTTNKSDIEGKRGIIFFDIPSNYFGENSGDINHLDLYDGSDCQKGCYWTEASEGYYFWEEEKKSYLEAVWDFFF